MTHRVLIVGQDAAHLAQAEASLRRAGHAALAVNDGVRAAVLARQFLPTVALLLDDPAARAAQEVLSLLMAHPATASLPRVAFDHDAPLPLVVDLLSGALVDLSPPLASGPELGARLDRVLGAEEGDPRREVAHHRRGPPTLRRIGEIIRRRKGTGALAIEGAGEPALLRFEGGRLGEARFGEHTGPEALEALLKLPAAAPWSFAFSEHATATAAMTLELDDLQLSPAKAPSAQPLPTLDPRAAPARPLRLLLCDDDDALLTLYRRFFERAGYETHTASDGARGYEAAVRERPDVILSDIMMPEVDGWGLLTKVRDDFRVRETPFVLLSCHGDYLSRLLHLDAGADDYLEKGLRGEAVVERVGAAVAQRQRLLASVAAGGPGFNARLSRIGPQFLLRALCAAGRAGLLVIDDGLTSYEVGVEGGCVAGAVARRGEHVIAGRDALASMLSLADAPLTFVAGPPGDDRSLEAECGPLLDELTGELNRGREATRERLLSENARLHFSAPLLEFYALVSTDVVRPLLAALRGGAAPRELLVRGDASPVLVEWLVKDLLAKGIARFEDAP